MKNFSYSIEITPAFHEIDILEVVWHGHYTKYFELAREALMEQYNYGYQGMRDSGYAWPIVDLSIRFSRPARYAQKLRITATLVEWENRLKINYRIYDLESNELLTKGHTMQVAMNIETRTMCFVSPNILFDKLGLNMP